MLPSTITSVPYNCAIGERRSQTITTTYRCHEVSAASRLSALTEFLASVGPAHGANVLLSGDSGTGKTYLSRLLTLRAVRGRKPCVILDVYGEHQAHASLLAGAYEWVSPLMTRHDYAALMTRSVGGLLYLSMPNLSATSSLRAPAVIAALEAILDQASFDRRPRLLVLEDIDVTTYHACHEVMGDFLAKAPKLSVSTVLLTTAYHEVSARSRVASNIHINLFFRSGRKDQEAAHHAFGLSVGAIEQMAEFERGQALMLSRDGTYSVIRVKPNEDERDFCEYRPVL